MLYRHSVVSLLLLCCLSSVSGAALVPEDESLQRAAERLSRKEYAAAQRAAQQALPSPQRSLVLGMAAVRLEQWDAGERELATVADDLPLLGDFALYYRASALSRQSRAAEALPLLDRLKKDYSGSPLLRSAALLSADILFENENHAAALAAYQRFIVTYPTGSDALKALLRSAFCREHQGDMAGAVRDLRNIWLSYPAKDVAEQAETALKRLAAAGNTIPPYSAEELFKRGCTLFDQRLYRQAAATFNQITPEALPEQFRGRLAFKQALALYRAKMNTEAETAFSRLAAPDSPYPEYRSEAAYWLAHILDRNDRKQQAITAFLNLAAAAPESDLADDALFQAALVSKSAGERQAAVSLFNKLTAEYPASPHGGRARWEAGWSTYLSGAYQAAAELFQHAAADQSYRERALYWRGRALQATGAADAAAESFVALREEFPTGYYALTIEKETGMRGNRVPSLDKTALADIQLPRGYERVKALLALGLREEAALELATCRQRDGGAFRNSIEHAGLYLALDNYRAAMGLLQRNQLSRSNPLAWAVLYPAGFHEIVARYSIASNVSESLTYALIKAESTFSPAVRSPVGAVGLMQLMPATARETAKNLGESLSVASLTTPEINVKLGTRHLKELLNRFDGNLINVIAAYNAGATPVNRWRKNFGQLRDDEFIENIPYPETREYVKKVLAGMEIYRRLYSLGDQPYPLAASQEQQTINKVTERYAQQVPLDR